jgi:hypothetical protein
MGIDRFGNAHAPNLSYARGEILRSTEDDFQIRILEGDEAVHKASRPKSSSQVTLCWREMDSNLRSPERAASIIPLTPRRDDTSGRTPVSEAGAVR